MCGFAGFIDATRSRGAAEMAALASRMSAAIRHRGPDDDGSWADESAGLAMSSRRLAIVDLSPAGHQPMSSASGRWRICFNGEIYGFADLREELVTRGVAFRGHSDTEVLLEAVEAWGLRGALDRCAGMYAFALWDARERRLHLVRDRMGEKPLYHGWQGDAFLFGSEIKALRVHPQWQGAIDREALALYLRFGYFPRPWTVAQGLRQLEPGTILTLGAEDVAARRLPEPVPYWSVLDAFVRGIESPFRGDDAEAVERLESLLRDAVRRQMVADVPLGAFLSGGIDSSTVVALMQEASSRPVRTFTIGFREAEFDEAPHARRVAAHLGTEHEEQCVTPEEAREVIPRLPEIHDEPFADPSQVPTFLVAALARRHVTVSLSGDGGDELFGGYNRYVWSRKAWSVLAPLPRPLRRAIASGVVAVPARAWSFLLRAAGPLLPPVARAPGAGARVHRLARLGTASGARDVYSRLVALWESPERLVVGLRDAPATRLETAGRDVRWRDLVEEMSYLDMVTYLPDDILVKVDRAAMAVSLESRVPLLDHRVVELAASLPPRLKLRGGQGKWVLRQVLARHVPPRLFERPKAGFGVPIGEWLRGPLRSWAEDLLDEGRLRREGLLEPRVVRAAWADHLERRRQDPYRLWAVLMLQAWLERWGAGTASTAGEGAAGAAAACATATAKRPGGEARA